MTLRTEEAATVPLPIVRRDTGTRTTVQLRDESIGEPRSAIVVGTFCGPTLLFLSHEWRPDAFVSDALECFRQLTAKLVDPGEYATEAELNEAIDSGEIDFVDSVGLCLVDPYEWIMGFDSLADALAFLRRDA